MGGANKKKPGTEKVLVGTWLLSCPGSSGFHGTLSQCSMAASRLSLAQWRLQRCVLAGAAVGLNDPVMVRRDERLSRFHVPVSDCRGRCIGEMHCIQNYTKKADNWYVRFQLISWWCYCHF